MSTLGEIQRMYDARARTLRLDGSRLGPVGASLVRTTGGASAVFGGVATAPSQAGGTVSFTATSLVLSGNPPRMVFPEQLIASIRADVLAAETTAPILVVAITVADGWSLIDSLPALVGSFWADIVARPGNNPADRTMIFLATGASRDAATGLDLAEGFAFRSRLDRTRGVLRSASLFLDQDPLAFGPFTVGPSGPTRFEFALSTPAAAAGLSALFRDLNVPVALSLVDDRAATPGDFGLAFASDLPWAGASHTLRALIPPSGPGVVELSLIGPVGLPAAGDIARYFGGNDPTDHLPASFKSALDSLRVGELAFGIGLGTRKVESARVTLVALTEKALEVVPPGLVEVADIRFTFSIFDPFGASPLTKHRLDGTLDIGGVDLIVAADLVTTARSPVFTVVAYMDEFSEIDLTMIAEKFGLPAGAPRIVVDDLHLSASTAPGYAIRAELSEHPASPNPGDFALTDLVFELVSDGSERTVSLEGAVTLAGVYAFVSLTNDGGWVVEGKAAHDAPIPLGTLIGELTAQFGVQASAALRSVTVEDLDVRLNTTTNAFYFNATGRFALAGSQIATTILLDVTPSGTGSYLLDVAGSLTIDTAVVTLRFARGDTSSRFSADWSDPSAPLSFAGLARTFGFINLPAMPPGVDLSLEQIGFQCDTAGQALAISAVATVFAKARCLFVTDRLDTGRVYVFAAQIMEDIDLANLPLVGGLLPTDATIRLERLEMLVSSAALSPNQVARLPIPTGALPLPADGVYGGLTFSSSIRFGSESRTLSIPSAPTLTPAPTVTSPSTDGVVASDNARWFVLQKSFGPVRFQRVGFKYEDGAAWFLLDASLSFAGLTLSLDGLAFGSALSPFAPKFDLKGIGIDYANGPVEIGGALLRVARTDDQGRPYDEYDGVAVIRTQALTLSALASYTELGGDPSLFLYAVLDYPLGGPAFFFVTGLTAGFGYNRALIVPAVDQVATFPLVTAATAKTPAPRTANDLTTILDGLASYVPPRTGAIFFAVGVKFTSFKMVDAFALLAVSFGDAFEVDVLGLATLVSPTPVPGATAAVTPLAVVQLALKASFQPANGFLGVAAQLTSESYLFTRNCRLTGGFAFYCWFAGPHQGDFVLSLGGYHPDYQVPAHYPQVPRLGFTWQVNDQLNVKGDAYYALTAAHLMAGGFLQMTYSGDKLKAWFTAKADFLVAWKPYHYDATMHVNVGATYTFSLFGTHTISVDVGADLHLWGPEFSGTIAIDLDVITFDVAFGPGASATPKAIDWAEFQESFLPTSDAVCGIALTDGLLRKNATDPASAPPESSEDLGAVEPKSLALVVNSVIPSTSALVRGVKVDQLTFATIGGATVALSVSGGVVSPRPSPGLATRSAPVVGIGVGPMGVAVGEFTSTQAIEITRDGAPAEDRFLFTPVVKDVPTGLWGDWGPSLRPTLNGARFVAGALAGFAVRPAPPADAPATQALDAGRLLLDRVTASPAFAWEMGGRAFRPDPRDEPARLAAIRRGLLAPATADARGRILAALAIDHATVRLDAQQVGDMADGFQAAPELELS